MDVTRCVSTNVEAGKKPGLWLPGAFQHFRKFPTVEFREVVRPNFDMPYWLAWFDVSKGPKIKYSVHGAQIEAVCRPRTPA